LLVKVDCSEHTWNKDGTDFGHVIFCFIISEREWFLTDLGVGRKNEWRRDEGNEMSWGIDVSESGQLEGA
jgi:hypothetical protein